MEIKTNIETVIRQLETYRNTLNDRLRLFMEALANIGVDYAKASFSTAIYDGDNDVSVQWVRDDENTLRVVAEGNAVLFIEFGTGLIGGGHPDAPAMGYGPGTWSDGPNGKRQWTRPDGWIYEHHTDRTHGNPPSESMRGAADIMRERIAEIALEVFASD